MPSVPVPSCVYGNPCFSICINPHCSKSGMICQKGYETRQQCYLFHQQCPQIKWSQLQKLSQQNPSTTTQQFLHFRLKIQHMFITAIQKIREEQQNFRIWMKTFGHSLQVMKFIKLMNDQNYDEITGRMLAPVVSSYFKEENNISRPPHIMDEQIREIQVEIEQSIENITSLYLRTIKRSKVKQQHSMANIPSSTSVTFIPDIKHITTSQAFIPENRPRHQTHNISRINQRYNQREQLSDGNVIMENKEENFLYQQDMTGQRQQEMMPKINSRICRSSKSLRRLFLHARPVSFRLLYRASQNSFSISQFHKACDNIPNTLVLIETEYGKVIGGFTGLQWKSNKKQWMADKNVVSFLFSLSLNEKYDLILPQFAISCNADKGPIFGCCDICIVDQADRQKSSAEFPISYNLNKKYNRGDQASLAFTGHPKGHFRTKQWEVFKVQFQ